MKSFLILGADSTLAKQFTKTHGEICLAVTRKECDITSIKDVERYLKNKYIKYVLNCAAITDTEFAEKNPEKCFSVNSVAVLNLNNLCLKHNKKLIQISSDYAVHLANVYGYSKLLSEKLVDQAHNLVVRTSFYSSNYYIVKSLLSGKATHAYKNMFFNPISINRLVDEIYKRKDQKGLINLFSDEKISKLKFAKMFAKTFGINRKLITPVDFKQDEHEVKLPLDSFVKSDINIPLGKDLLYFKKFRPS